MPIRTIKIPSDVTLVAPFVPDTDLQPVVPQFTFAQFVETLLNQERWSSDYKHVQAASAIYDAVRSAKKGEIQLAEDDWSKLSESAQNPGKGGYGLQPWVMRQIVPYFQAILGAK